MAETRTPSPAAKVRVERGVPAAEAAQGVLAAQCRIIESLFPLVQRPADPWDPEYLHDLRVAVRRSRSVLRQLRPAFPRADWRRHRRYLRWLQQTTGPARDVDVLTTRWDELTAGLAAEHPEGTTALTDRLAFRRAATLADLPETLGTRSAEAGLAEWARFVTAVPGGTDQDNQRRWRRPAAHRPIEQLVAPRLRQLVDEVTDPDRVRPGVSDDDLHELRKQGKELRYLLELFGVSVLSEADVAEGRKILKALQTELGRHQDSVVHRSLVLDLAAEEPDDGGPGGPMGDAGADVDAGEQVVAAARAVADRLDGDRAEARRRIPDRLGVVADWYRALSG